MTIRRKMIGPVLVLVAAVVFAALPASAQVERAIVEAEGISRACSPGLETALKSLSSVYQYAISVPKQMFSVTYYNGESFSAKDLRWAADKGEAEVLRIHVSATGRVVDDGDQQFFLSGEDRYQVVSDKKLPANVHIGMIGVVDDQAKPMKITPDDFKVLPEEPASSEDPAAKSSKPSEPGVTGAGSSESN
jgi:hypothetical protein